MLFNNEISVKMAIKMFCVFSMQIWSWSRKPMYKGKPFNLLSIETQHRCCFIMYLASLSSVVILHSCKKYFQVSFLQQSYKVPYKLCVSSDIICIFHKGRLPHQASAASRTNTIISHQAKGFEGWIQILVRLHGGSLYSVMK